MNLPLGHLEVSIDAESKSYSKSTDADDPSCHLLIVKAANGGAEDVDLMLVEADNHLTAASVRLEVGDGSVEARKLLNTHRGIGADWEGFVGGGLGLALTRGTRRGSRDKRRGIHRDVYLCVSV